MILAEQIGALVTLSLSCPAMGFGGGSAMEERAQDAWARKVHAEAGRLHALVLGHDPRAVRIIEKVQDETYNPDLPARRAPLPATTAHTWTEQQVKDTFGAFIRWDKGENGPEYYEKFVEMRAGLDRQSRRL